MGLKDSIFADYLAATPIDLTRARAHSASERPFLA